MTKSLKAAVCGWLGCVCALILLALLAYKVDPIQRLDATAFSRLAVADGTRISSLASAITHLADLPALLLMLAGICGYAVFRGRPRGAVAAVAVVAGANLTTQILKVALAHPRYQPILGWDQLNSAAFPSGHATAAASIALALIFVVPRRNLVPAAVFGAAYVFAIAVSVLVLSWHYPSDVAGGVIVALGWAFAVQALLLLTRSSPSRNRVAGWPSELPSR
jgi:membrane-associated phospholipid phosphatase